ncbi:MAG: hypothetical protein ACRD68_01540 [Pyrinomonadaceae bacterium]
MSGMRLAATGELFTGIARNHSGKTGDEVEGDLYLAMLAGSIH